MKKKAQEEEMGTKERQDCELLRTLKMVDAKSKKISSK